MKDEIPMSDIGRARKNNILIEPEIPKGYDLVVIGGGMAGVCAAIAAARHGCRTALVQDRPVLGGNSSSEIRMHICGADYIFDGMARRETGIIEELRLADLARNPQRSPSMWDMLLYESVKAEPRLELYLNTLALEPIMENGRRIKAVRARQMASEREFILQADLFADCSGDGQIAAQAGADFVIGRESAAVYGESLANETEDRYTLGSSLMFMAHDMGSPMPFVKPAWAYSYPSDEALQHREHGYYRYGYWWIEWGGQFDTIKDNEAIKDELLKILYGVWDHIKNHGRHGAENWALEWVGMVPGKRESRRFMGDYVLRQSDLEEGCIFEDEVAYGGWPIDIHPIEGIGNSSRPCTHTTVPLYSIPLRSLYSRNIENLFIAGRNASASHIAFASTRVMATCALMGQAVGTAAAVCSRERLIPRQAAADKIEAIQEMLLKDDVYLLGHRDTGRGNLARQGSLKASSSVAGCEAANLLDGINRPQGESSHSWKSSNSAGEDTWLEISWKEKQRIGRLQLLFDSHLEERLFLTQESFFYQRDHVITRIPERLVKAFKIQVFTDGDWQTVRSVKNNIRRRCVEEFSPMLHTDRIRLVFTETWGSRVVTLVSLDMR